MDENKVWELAQVLERTVTRQDSIVKLLDKLQAKLESIEKHDGLQEERMGRVIRTGCIAVDNIRLPARRVRFGQEIGIEREIHIVQRFPLEFTYPVPKNPQYIFKDRRNICIVRHTFTNLTIVAVIPILETGQEVQKHLVRKSRLYKFLQTLMTLSLQELTRIGKIADLRTKRRIDTVQQDLFVRMQTRRNILKRAVRRQQIGCCIGERAEFLHNLRKEILRY